MSGPRVVYAPDVPAEVRAAAEPIFRRWGVVAPSWCHDVRVAWSDAASEDAEPGTDRRAEVDADEGNRQACVTLYPCWLAGAPDERERDVLHELAHLATWPLWSAFVDLLAPVKKRNPAAYAACEREGRRAVEGATCDLAAAFAALASSSSGAIPAALELAARRAPRTVPTREEAAG